MIPKSIRCRIQAWHGSLLVCLVTALLVTFYFYECGERFHEIDSRLESLLTPLLPRVTPPGPPVSGPEDFHRPPPGRDGPPENQPSVFANFEGGATYYIVWSPNGKIVAESPHAPTIPVPGPGHAPGPDLVRTRGEYREIVHFGPNRDCVLLGTSIASTNSQLHRLAVVLVGVGTAIIAFGLIGGWWVAGHALRPISQISEAAETIAEGNLSRRIDVGETESELGQLVSVLNHTFARLETAFEQQLRFTADASHELRTPISVMLTQIQLALSRPRDAEFYRQTLETCSRAAERMRVLVNSLLELARMDSGEFELSPENCDLARIARESVEFVTPLIREKNAVLRESLDSVPMRADTLRLGQIVVNLLSNAIQHNPEGTEISISVKRNIKHAILRVADNGGGILPEALPHIFDRFYRADKSRTRASGNNGLGLAISKGIVEAHGGTIRVQSEPGKGTEFVVELPLNSEDSQTTG